MSRTALFVLIAVLPLGACGARGPRPATAPAPVVAAPEVNVTPARIDSTWAHAMDEYRRGKWESAATDFQSVLLELPSGDPRIVRARFLLAETKLAQGDELEAARQFREVSDQTPDNPLAPDALLRAGDSYAQLWRNPELDPTYGQTALATYQELLNRYPGTPAAVRAAARINGLNDEFAYKQYKAALYYLRLKAYDSAILYLKDLVATYPRAEVAPDALLRLVAAYRAQGYQEDVNDTCGYLRRFHPGTPGLADACPAGTDSTAGASPAGPGGS